MERARAYLDWFGTSFPGLTTETLATGGAAELARLDQIANRLDPLRALLVGPRDGASCFEARLADSDAVIDQTLWDSTLEACFVPLRAAIGKSSGVVAQGAPSAPAAGRGGP